MWKEGVQKGIKDLEAIKKIIIEKYPETAKHERIVWHGSWRLVEKALEKGVELVMKPPQASQEASSASIAVKPTASQPPVSPVSTPHKDKEQEEGGEEGGSSTEVVDELTEEEGGEEPQKGPVAPEVLYQFIQPLLSEGASYTAIATKVGKKFGHEASVLLEKVASSVEQYRKEKKNSMAIYPLIEKDYLHKFASFTLALCSYHYPLTAVSPLNGKA
jgi:hypothetical protein